MATFTCPECKKKMVAMPDNYRGTFQCTECANVSRVTMKNGHAVDVRSRTFDLDIPDGLPDDLEKILSEAILCYEVGSNAGAVVLSGLFIEGLLSKAGISGTTREGLFKMIQKAHNDGIISEFGFHVATASRMLRNIGAHYSEDLIKLKASDARLVLEMVRKLSDDIIEAGVIKA